MWRHASAVVVGSGHERNRLPCQDSIVVRRFPRRMIVAVADGMGRAQRARFGARLATHRLVEEAVESVTDSMSRAAIERSVRSCFGRTRRALAKAAAQFGAPLEEFATTALLLVATPGLVITGHVGDGGAILVTSQGSYITASEPEQGRYANETYSLTDEHFAEHLRVNAVRHDVCGIGAFSDGIQAQALDSEKHPRPEFWSPAFRWLHERGARAATVELRRFLSSADLRAESDDDMSLVLALLEG